MPEREARPKLQEPASNHEFTVALGLVPVADSLENLVEAGVAMEGRIVDVEVL